MSDKPERELTREEHIEQILLFSIGATVVLGFLTGIIVSVYSLLTGA